MLNVSFYSVTPEFLSCWYHNDILLVNIMQWKCLLQYSEFSCSIVEIGCFIRSCVVIVVQLYSRRFLSNVHFCMHTHSPATSQQSLTKCHTIQWSIKKTFSTLMFTLISRTLTVIETSKFCGFQCLCLVSVLTSAFRFFQWFSHYRNRRVIMTVQSLGFSSWKIQYSLDYHCLWSMCG